VCQCFAPRLLDDKHLRAVDSSKVCKPDGGSLLLARLPICSQPMRPAAAARTTAWRTRPELLHTLGFRPGEVEHLIAIACCRCRQMPSVSTELPGSTMLQNQWYHRPASVRHVNLTPPPLVLDAGTDDLRARYVTSCAMRREMRRYTHGSIRGCRAGPPDSAGSWVSAAGCAMAVPKHLVPRPKYFGPLRRHRRIAARRRAGRCALDCRPTGGSGFGEVRTHHQQPTYLPGIASGETYFPRSV